MNPCSKLHHDFTAYTAGQQAQHTVLVKAHALHACVYADSALRKRAGKRPSQLVSHHLHNAVLSYLVMPFEQSSTPRRVIILDCLSKRCADYKERTPRISCGPWSQSSTRNFLSSCPASV